MATRTLEEDVREECKLLYSASGEVSLGRVVAPDPGGLGGERPVEVGSLLATPRVDGTPARAWLLTGESGRGKSSVARYLAIAWATGATEVEAIHDFQAVMVIGVDVSCWEAVKGLLPNTCAHWGPARLAQWMEDAHVLVIIDDFVLKTGGQEVQEALEEWTKASFLILTTPADAPGTAAIMATHRATLCLRMPGLERSDDVVALAAQHLPVQALQGLREWLSRRWAVVGEALSYPGLVPPLCSAWSRGRLTDTVKTTTELLWLLLEALLAQETRVDAGLLQEWLLVLGSLTRRSLETRKLSDRMEMETEARKLFPAGLAEEIAVSLLPFSRSAASARSLSLPHPLTQVLAAWDALHRNLRGTPLKALVKRLHDEDSVVLHVAGHLARLLRLQPDLPDKQLVRVTRSLVLHMDRASDRFGYTLKAMQEAGLHPRVVSLLLEEVEFPRQWEVYDAAVLLPPLEVLLQHHTPQKVVVSVERGRSAPDLEAVVGLLADRGVPMFLAEMNHLAWQGRHGTDRLLLLVQESDRGRLQDLMGCLGRSAIGELGKAAATRGLVCLRLRVTDAASAEAVLRCPSDLASLMWLEVDFDLPLHDLDKSRVSRVPTPLMDVSFRDLRDEDVPFLCEFLARLRRRYSGVHLMRSELTPQGVTEVLKQFFRRGMLMASDPALVDAYRRWRFPVLATAIPAEEPLDDEVVQHLLGYDDRCHYNDNEARSSILATRIDARALANFFAAMEDLLHFRYFCTNFSVVKNTDGSTEVKDLVQNP